MNISYSWLKQYIPLTLSPEELAAALTSIGLETGSVERVESIKGGLRGIVIGKVLTCIDHPDSDHLHITTVDLGGGKVEQIVCGAPNVAAGQTVVVATVGTTLYDGDKEFKIKKSKIRGVESSGMICAEDEIGVGHSHDGIIVIDREVAPGTEAAEFYGLTDDYVLEVDLTPNRVDAASHWGVARDLFAWSAEHADRLPLLAPDDADFKVDNPEIKGVSVKVEDTEGCPRYCGVTIKGVTVKESPDWLKERLTAVGLHPINNVVDITNYILLGMGQPLHCFDADKIAGEEIVVRTCPEGTPFTTLDGVERKLSAADLMICDADKPLCIAGVFGGLDSGVTEQTTNVFLESAYFNPTRVRKTARRHGLSTDASFRFERGIDPNACMYMLRLAAILVKELAGGEIVGEVENVQSREFPPFDVTLSYKNINDLIGKEIPEATVDSILNSLSIKIVDKKDGVLQLQVPTFRVDVQRPCDVIEDILRIYGYNNVEMPSEVRSSLSFRTPVDIADDMRRRIAEQLCASGFNEILNNSLTAERYYAELQSYPVSACVRLLNPLSQDLNVMRQTLLFGGLESIAHNINRKQPDLLFFEFGNTYYFNPEAESTAEKPLAPYSEQSRLALWLTGNHTPASWEGPAREASFFTLKAAVANIFARLGINSKEITLAKGSSDLFSQSLTIATRSGKVLGEMGIVAPTLLKMADIKQPVRYAELDWAEITRMTMPRTVTFAPLPKTQPVKRDLALLIDSSVSMEQVEKAVREVEKKLLREVSLFDVYEGKNLPEGKKSYAIAITLQDDEKTLQDKHIDLVMQRIIDNLKKKVGAELR